MIHSIDNLIPEIALDTFVAWNAEVAGDVSLSEGVSVWFSATVRADIAPIKIGKNSNVQDNAVLHVDYDVPCLLGEYVTIGHGAILHSCKIEDGTTVGMGAIILNNAHIGKNCMVAAGSVVPPGKEYPDGSMIMGSPAKVVRDLRPEEIQGMKENALHYTKLGREAKNSYREQEKK